MSSRLPRTTRAKKQDGTVPGWRRSCLASQSRIASSGLCDLWPPRLGAHRAFSRTWHRDVPPQPLAKADQLRAEQDHDGAALVAFLEHAGDVLLPCGDDRVGGPD